MRILATSVLILTAAWLTAAAPPPAAAGDRHSSVSRFGADVHDGIVNPRGKPPRHAIKPDHTRRHHLDHPRPGKPQALLVPPRHRPHASVRSRAAPMWTHRHSAFLFRPAPAHRTHLGLVPQAKLPPHRIVHRLQAQRWTGIGPVRELGRTYEVEAYDRRLKRHSLEVDGTTGHVLRVIPGR